MKKNAKNEILGMNKIKKESFLNLVVLIKKTFTAYQFSIHFFFSSHFSIT